MKKVGCFFKIIGLVVCALVILNIYLGYTLHISDNNNIIMEEISPDKKYKAVVFERNINATTKQSYQLSIINANDEIKNKPGNVFISYYDFEVYWEDESVLHVKNKKENDKLKKKKEYKHIKILYDN